ncbi:MAG: T9SS type A sorting domain-containing protein [Bacteroidia bacterium]|nr:T9SS type A sorting domain-containing protein [Bacteroidia bacterium]
MKRFLLCGLGCFFALFVSAQTEYSVEAQDTIWSCFNQSIILDGHHTFYYIQPFVCAPLPSLVDQDHTAEGFMVTLSDGRIVHFFRLDPGINGDHVGNHGRIVKRTSSDDGLVWSPNEEVFDDPYLDDRNVHGGLIGQDSIVLFFRRFNATDSTQVDLNYIYSLDAGMTWSPRIVVNSISNGTFGTGHISKIPGLGFLMSITGSYYAELRLSNDGLDWTNILKVWDYTTDHQFNFGEACFIYIGNGRIMGLIRDNDQNSGATFFQVCSTDSGQSWTEPVNTNIGAPYFCPSPMLFYDDLHEDLWVVATDRRNYCGSGSAFDAHLSDVWVYRNKIDDVFDHPDQFNMVNQFSRPFPSWYRFYGYPAYARTLSGNFLVVFTESWSEPNGTEDADFYQFNIKYYTLPIESSVYAWNTGDTTGQINVDTAGTYSVFCTDSLGHSRTDSVYVNMINSSIVQQDLYIHKGEDVNLSCNNLETDYIFHWSTGASTPCITVSPVITTTYNVYIENGIFGCTDSVTIHVLDRHDFSDEEKPSSIDSIPANHEASVTPNPFTDKAYINMGSKYKVDEEILIFDFSGRVVRTYDHINSDKIEIDRNGLSSGVYFISVRNNSGIIYINKLVAQ